MRNNTINEISKLYDMVDEIKSEYERLLEMATNGEANEADLIRLGVYEHLINKWRH